MESECNIKQVEEEISHLQLQASNMRKTKQDNIAEKVKNRGFELSDGESDKSFTKELHFTKSKDVPEWFYDLGASKHVTSGVNS